MFSHQIHYVPIFIHLMTTFSSKDMYSTVAASTIHFMKCFEI